MIGIYKVTSPTGKVYIGQSWNISNRLSKYKNLNCKSQTKLCRSLNKYGFEAHQFEIIHELPTDVTQDILDTYEQLYMDLYRDAGVELLNLKEAGSKGKHSEKTKQKMKRIPSNETKQKMSKAHKGKVLSDEHKNNLSKAAKGKKLKPLSSERKIEIGNQHRGKIISEETKRKTSEAIKEWWRNRKNNNQNQI